MSGPSASNISSPQALGAVYAKLSCAASTLDKKLAKSSLLNDMERRTGVPKLYMAPALLLVLSLVMNWAASFLSSLVGFVYPAYRSFKSIESDKPSEDRLWLTYWTVFAFISVSEYLVGTLLSWIPFYYLLKTALLVYMFLPSSNGALTVYGRLVRPALARLDHELSLVHAEVCKKK